MTEGLYALFGALMGAGASVIAMLIQQKYQHKRDLLKIATEVARDDWNNRNHYLQEELEGGSMPPVSVFIHYHYRVLIELSKGDFSDRVISQISDEQDRIVQAYKSRSDHRKRE